MKTIALEEHFITPMYQEKVTANDYRNAYVESRGRQIGHDIYEQYVDIDAKRLAYMDAAGVDVQVLSLGSPGAQGFAAPIAIPMARDANDRMHAAVQKHPTRFTAFAALPTASTAAAVSEFDRAVTQLGFKGAMIHSHTQGEFLDDKKYWPIFERAAAHDLPIYLHPALPHPALLNSYFAGYEELSRAAWGFMLDASCHFLRLVFSGLFDEYPKLKIILGHLGEGLPFAMHRLHDHTYMAAQRRGLKKSPLEYFRDNLVVTTSGNWYPPAFDCTLAAIGEDNILFAVDWPFEPNKVAVEFLGKLNISETVRAKIAHGNAERLLKMAP